MCSGRISLQWWDLYIAECGIRIAESRSVERAVDECVEAEDHALAREGDESGSLLAEKEGSAASQRYRVIFKMGDDLRQDQLMIQMITLMDSLLKSVNLDLCLTPYRVLATAATDGFVELPPGPNTYAKGFVATVYRW